jgi:hypothetical protein
MPGKVVFLSKNAVHMIPYKLFQVTSTGSGGQLVTKAAMSQLKFENRRLETDDEEVITYIRKHPRFGIDFLEQPQAPAPSPESAGQPNTTEVPPAGTPEVPPAPPAPLADQGPTQVTGIKSKNDGITYLIGTGKFLPAELKGKTVAEIQALALERVKVVFPDWKLPEQGE